MRQQRKRSARPGWNRSTHQRGGAGRSWSAARPPAPLPYHPRRFLLSREELAFWNVLRSAIDTARGVAPKVRLADIVNCDEDSWRSGHWKRLGPRHVDFALFDLDSSRIRLVIELDDPSHGTESRRRSDGFLDRALAAAGVAILRVPVTGRYDPTRLGDQIRALLDTESQDKHHPAPSGSEPIRHRCDGGTDGNHAAGDSSGGPDATGFWRSHRGRQG